MTTVRDFIQHPMPAYDPRSIPAGQPIGRNLTCGTKDFPHMPILPPPTAFFVKPDLRGLLPFRCVWNRARTSLLNR